MTFGNTRIEELCSVVTSATPRGRSFPKTPQPSAPPPSPYPHGRLLFPHPHEIAGGGRPGTLDGATGRRRLVRKTRFVKESPASAGVRRSGGLDARALGIIEGAGVRRGKRMAQRDHASAPFPGWERAGEGGRDDHSSLRLRARAGRNGAARARRVCRRVSCDRGLAASGCGVIQKTGWSKPWARERGSRHGCAARSAPGSATRDPARASRMLDDHDRRAGDPRPATTKTSGRARVIGAPVGAVVCVCSATSSRPAGDRRPALRRRCHLRPSPPPEPVVKRRIVCAGVNFDFDRADIRPDSRPILDQAARSCARTGRALVGEGNGRDGDGTSTTWRCRSARSEAVFRYLVNRGIAPNGCASRARRVAPGGLNDTEIGRAQNGASSCGSCVSGSRGDTTVGLFGY